MTEKKQQGSKTRARALDDRGVRTAKAVAMELRLAELAIQSRKIASESGLSRRAIAERMGLTSASTVQRILGPDSFYNVTIETLWRFAIACGSELTLEFRAAQRPKVAESQPHRLDLFPKVDVGKVIDLQKWRERAASAIPMSSPTTEVSECEPDCLARCGGV